MRAVIPKEDPLKFSRDEILDATAASLQKAWQTRTHTRVTPSEKESTETEWPTQRMRSFWAGWTALPPVDQAQHYYILTQVKKLFEKVFTSEAVSLQRILEVFLAQKNINKNCRPYIEYISKVAANRGLSKFERDLYQGELDDLMAKMNQLIET